MNLSRMLARREAEGDPVKVGIIGCGKFGAMYLSQARLTKGIHVVGIADLNVARAGETLTHIGWDPDADKACGRWPLRECAAEIAKQDLFWSIDTGLLHIA